MKSKLLVEGKYDDQLIRKICERLALSFEQHFEIEGKGGIEALLDSLEVELSGSSAVVAVVCDADEDCGRRWEEIKLACGKGGLELGDEAVRPGGFIWNRPAQQRFGCWIMPDNQQSGAIEGRLLDGLASATQQELRAQSRRFVDTVEPRLFSNTEAAMQKATLRAWFAVQEEAIWLPSFAVGERLLLPTLEENDAFAGWLRELEQIASLPLA